MESSRNIDSSPPLDSSRFPTATPTSKHRLYLAPLSVRRPLLATRQLECVADSSLRQLPTTRSTVLDLTSSSLDNGFSRKVSRSAPRRDLPAHSSFLVQEREESPFGRFSSPSLPERTASSLPLPTPSQSIHVTPNPSRLT